MTGCSSCPGNAVFLHISNKIGTCVHSVAIALYIQSSPVPDFMGQLLTHYSFFQEDQGLLYMVSGIPETNLSLRQLTVCLHEV